MPPAPLAVKAETDTRDRAGAIDAPAPAPLTNEPGRRKRRDLLLLRRSGCPGQTSLPVPTCPEGTGSARPEIRGSRLPRVPGLRRREAKTARSYRDPLFEHPDLVENDYYRFQNYRHG
jgi:hypothetical protein